MADPTIQISPLPTTSEVALTLIQWLFATTGQITDYNIGSVIRTYSEAIGAVEETESISAQAQALQSLVYSAYTAFGIFPFEATSAVGNVTVATLSGTPLPAGQSVNLPIGMLLQTSGGILFSTSASAVLVSGTISVNIPIQASQTGSSGNVAANTVNQIVTGLPYPLAVTNPLPTAGGSNAETPSQTLARFTAYVQSLGLCSPVAIAGAVIGVTFQQEVVKYSTVYENWITQVNEGDPTPDAGFTVGIDDGAGTASADLIAATDTYLSSGLPAGFRPAGVPYNVVAVTPVLCSVVVVATAINTANAVAIQTAMGQAINLYFQSLGFAETAEITQLIAQIANVTFGQLTSLSVTLLDSLSVSQTEIDAGPLQRVILQGFSVTVN